MSGEQKAGGLDRYEAPDGGYGWVVAAAGFCCMLFTPGLSEAFGVFFIEFREYFEVDAQQVSWIASIMMSMTFFCSPIAAGLSNRFDVRRTIFLGGILSSAGLILSSFATSIPFLYITFGVITGAAYGLVVVPTVLIISYYFKQKHAMANGIAFAGASMGVVIFPPLCHGLIEYYGWRGSLFLLGSINLNICVFATLMRSPPLKKHPAPVPHANDILQEKPLLRHEGQSNALSANNESTQTQRPKGIDCNIWKDNYLFTIYVIAVFFLGFSTFTPLVHLVPRAVYQGVSHGKAAWVVSVIGLTGFAGRLFHGVPISKGYVTSYQFFTITIFLIGFITIIFGPIGGSYTKIMVYAALYGTISGCYNPLVAVVMKDVVASDALMPTGMGLTLLIYGLGHLIGAPVAGRLYDMTGGYKASFMVAGFVYILSGCILCLRKCCGKCQKGRDLEIIKERKRKERRLQRRQLREQQRLLAGEQKQHNVRVEANNVDGTAPLNFRSTAVNMYGDYSDDSYADSLEDTNV
ncbi:monocarboxylate transporter 12-like [Saccoglossus kowalevskii]|uniref:Monocarboxylate transporter 12-like n=1 Tax=Saccoglossus kowalevskii TaxID=10224 RepID=A0ABM0GUT6_SACKO|nr:PREDICTED: monocarboxylate transporter 12-like [Saccoglossus kowalevskii]